MVFELLVAKIAAHKLKERRRHELLQQPERFFLRSGFIRISRSFNRNKVPKIHSFLLEGKRRERNVAINPCDPFAGFHRALSGFKPERGCARAKRTLEKCQRTFRKAMPEQEAIKLSEASRQTFGMANFFWSAEVFCKLRFQLLNAERFWKRRLGLNAIRRKI